MLQNMKHKREENYFSRDVIFDEASMMKLIDSQQLESNKTKEVSPWWKVMLVLVL